MIITWGDRVLTGATSISDPGPLTVTAQWWRYIQYKSDLAFANPPPGKAAPVYIPEGVNGTQWTGLDARLSAELTKWQPTKCILECGINESLNGIAQAVAIPAATSVFNKLAGIPVLYLLPVCAGEVWTPPNANAFDAGVAGITAYNVSLSALVAGFPNVQAVDGRAAWQIYEQLNNLPSPGVSFGPATNPDAQRVHPNPVGRAKLWGPAGMTAVVFQR